jgi:hypothetical protein
MDTVAKPTRENRAITVDFQSEATYFKLLGDGKAFLKSVLAFVVSLGFQLQHKAICRRGRCLTSLSHHARVRQGGLTIWRIQRTVLSGVHGPATFRFARPPDATEVDRDALWATHGGLNLELCTMVYIFPPGRCSAPSANSATRVWSRC